MGGPARRWRRWTLLIWLVASAALLLAYRQAIDGFMLSDTDDNLRMMQARALLGGQGWYDLRQYRLSPPAGFDVHWSRLVDLPLVAVMAPVSSFFGGVAAQKAAAAIAPLFALGASMFAMGAAARRLIAPAAFALGAALLLLAPFPLGMWRPTRVDHHGWQLFCLLLLLAGLADPRARRGGATVGAAVALSLTIGLEMLPFLGLGIAALVLSWLWDGRDRPALLGLAATLGAGTLIGFLLFASSANRAPVCDALSPVWLTMALAGSGLVALLAVRLIERRWVRVVGAGTAALLLAGLYAFAFPQCLQRLEGVSPELDRLWLSRVREAKPIWESDAKAIFGALSLPLIGLLGAAYGVWESRSDRVRLRAWGGLAAMLLAGLGLLNWQLRAISATQLLAVPGAALLVWRILPAIVSSRLFLVRTLGAAAALLLLTGLGSQLLVAHWPAKATKPNPRERAVALANGHCPTLGALRPVALQPRGLVWTFNDLGPRLISVTHHDAISGPYHRNGEAILDVMRGFRGTPETARAIAARRGVDYVLICPWMSESTLYAKEAPNGFYAQLAKGRAPGWLEPVRLPEGSPYRMWRVKKG